MHVDEGMVEKISEYQSVLGTYILLTFKKL